MGGNVKTSTIDAITRGQQFAYSKLKMETPLEVTLNLSGHLLLLLSCLVTVMRCCSTCLAAVTSQTNKQEKRYGAVVDGDLVLMEDVLMS